MIFQHTAGWVLGVSPHTGKPKTLTSRPIKPGDYIHRENEASGIIIVKDTMMRRKYVYAQTYAIQPGWGKPAIGRFRLSRIYRAEQAGELSQEEAEAEGFATPDDFREVWRKLYGEEALTEPCWRLVLQVLP